MKVAFLDRDGVINKEIGYLHKVSDFEYTENCIRGLKIISEKGYAIVIITNQAGIAKGYFTESQYHSLTNWYLQDLKKSLVPILKVIYCPHHEKAVIKRYLRACSCRKPNTGMIDKVVKEFDVDLQSSILIGDKQSDIDAGQNAGIGACYFVRSGQTPKEVAAFDSLYAVALAL